MKHTVTYMINEDSLILETGHMAKQANGAVFAKYGGSAVIATACCAPSATEGLDFVPLTVEYNEKYYAAGKIPGGFIKRETRPKDKEILVSRLIDRPMRPLFDKAFGREIQVVPTCISTDQVNPPDIVGINAASAAVHVSDIPFAGPIAAVRVCHVDGRFVINPTFDQIDRSQLEVVVAGTRAGITMVEGDASEVAEALMLEAIERARGPITDICDKIEKLRAEAGKPKLPLAPLNIQLIRKDEIAALARGRLSGALFTRVKQERGAAISFAIRETLAAFPEVAGDPIQKKLFDTLME
ncbi:MAG TPA: polyribonucleotide nucleotidyltransferase, partial [Magnetospirillaceae bacterium]|nr:polyribonucleotide nucleotidyltransferase [Magnetospirillaceae bacterium]